MAHRFIIPKIKTYWRKRWNEKKLDITLKESWTDGNTGSGKLPNPAKVFI